MSEMKRVYSFSQERDGFKGAKSVVSDWHKTGLPLGSVPLKKSKKRMPDSGKVSVEQLLYQGFNNREIGEKLGIKKNSVEARLGRIYKMHGVKSARELMVKEIARLRRLVKEETP